MLSAPFVFALGVWRHWWRAEHAPLTYVALGAIGLSLNAVVAAWLRQGAKSNDFRRMLQTAGVLYACLFAGWVAANTSGIVQMVLGFLAVAFGGAMTVGLLIGITAAISGEEIDDFHDHDGSATSWVGM